MSPEDQLDDVIEVGLTAEWGEFGLTDIRGLTFVNLTDRFVRFRGTQHKVQESLQQLEYTPPKSAFKLLDHLYLDCIWTNYGSSHRHREMRQNRVHKEMHLTLQDPPLLLKFDQRHFVVNEDEVGRSCERRRGGTIFSYGRGG